MAAEPCEWVPSAFSAASPPRESIIDYGFDETPTQDEDQHLVRADSGDDFMSAVAIQQWQEDLQPETVPLAADDEVFSEVSDSMRSRHDSVSTSELTVDTDTDVSYDSTGFNLPSKALVDPALRNLLRSRPVLPNFDLLRPHKRLLCLFARRS